MIQALEAFVSGRSGGQPEASALSWRSPFQRTQADAWSRHLRTSCGVSGGASGSAYATASLAGVPLLFKGSDFTQTDIASVL